MGVFSEFVAEIEDVFIEGDGRFDIEVVGELDFQKHLSFLYKSYSKKNSNKLLIAKLHYENVNPNDKKAIRVVVNGGTVGYLSRKNARLFRKRLKKAGFKGIVISCNARIFGGKRTWLFKKTDFSLRLDLPIKKL